MHEVASSISVQQTSSCQLAAYKFDQCSAISFTKCVLYMKGIPADIVYLLLFRIEYYESTMIGIFASLKIIL